MRSSSEGPRPVGALLQLIPLRMLASSGMSKLVLMILLLHSTFVWVRSVLLLAGGRWPESPDHFRGKPVSEASLTREIDL